MTSKTETPRFTAAEACARVDGWGATECFGIHDVGRALREEVRRLEGVVQHLEGVAEQVVFGFYEEPEPIFTQGHSAAGYLSEPVTAEQMRWLVSEIATLRRVAEAAAAYRDAETDGTPRLWRGVALQDLADALDQRLSEATFGKPRPLTGLFASLTPEQQGKALGVESEDGE